MQPGSKSNYDTISVPASPEVINYAMQQERLLQDAREYAQAAQEANPDNFDHNRVEAETNRYEVTGARVVTAAATSAEQVPNPGFSLELTSAEQLRAVGLHLEAIRKLSQDDFNLAA